VATGAISAGDLISSDNINISSVGDLTICGNITATGSVNNTISLTAGGSIIELSGLVTSNQASTGTANGTVVLTATGGSVGTLLTPILTAASNLQTSTA